MDLVGLLMGLLGCGVVTLWLAVKLGNRQPELPVAKHRAVTPRGIIDVSQSEAEATVFSDLVSRWIAETPALPAAPRIQRRGFGTNLARLPARRRIWSPFVYRTMWAGLYR